MAPGQRAVAVAVAAAAAAVLLAVLSGGGLSLLAWLALALVLAPVALLSGLAGSIGTLVLLEWFGRGAPSHRAARTNSTASAPGTAKAKSAESPPAARAAAVAAGGHLDPEVCWQQAPGLSSAALRLRTGLGCLAICVFHSLGSGGGGGGEFMSSKRTRPP